MRLIPAVLALALTACTTVPSPARFALDPVWVRVGDTRGSVDSENGIAEVESTVFSPDDRLIAAVSKDAGDVSVWTLDGVELWRRHHDNEPLDEVEAIAWTSDSAYLLTGGEDRRVRVWRVADGAQVTSLPTDGSIEGMALSPDGRVLAVGDEAGQLYLFDVAAADPAQWPLTPIAAATNGPDMDHPRDPGPKDAHADINSISWTSDGKRLFTAGRNGLVRMWAAPGLTRLREFTGFKNSIKSVRLSPDGALVAAGGQLSPHGLVLVWDVASGREVARLDFPSFPKIEAVEWSPDGRILLAGGIEGFDFAAGPYKEGMPPSGRNYPANGGQGAIRAYDRAAGFAKVAETPVFRQEYFDFTRDGSMLVSAHGDGTLRLWRVRR
jgi:WD40 repeat protein